jgi:hypothetical protein
MQRRRDRHHALDAAGLENARDLDVRLPGRFEACLGECHRAGVRAIGAEDGELELVVVKQWIAASTERIEITHMFRSSCIDFKVTGTIGPIAERCAGPGASLYWASTRFGTISYHGPYAQSL